MTTTPPEPGELTADDEATPKARPVKVLADLARPVGIHALFALAVSAPTMLLLEAARTGWDWAYLGDLIARKPGVMAMGTLVVMVFVTTLLCLVGRMWITATVVIGLSIVLGTASHVKYEIRHEPVYPRDLVFLREPGFLLEMASPSSLWLTVAGLVVVGAVTWLMSRAFTIWLRKRPSSRGSGRRRAAVLAARIATAGLGVALLSSLAGFNHAGNPWRAAFESAGAAWAKANQVNNYRANGFLGGFLYNLDVPAMKRPPGYSRATMERIAAEYAALAEHENEQEGRTPGALHDVNVVSVLSESFSDPTRLAGIELGEDPIPNTRALMEDLPHGLMLSQKIGGGTSSMEFETLTGMSLAQFNSAMDTPYQMLVPNYRSFPSAVEMFNQLGHTTLAIHPYRATMYQRDHVYPILGFSDFIDMTEMAHRARREDNRFVGDIGAFLEVEDALASHEEPLFVNLVTMQNHTPYLDKYADPVDVEGLDGEDAELMGQYARGLTYTDRALASFLRRLGRSDEKTVVLFYGDHLPGVPEPLYAQNSDRVLHETPFFIYANFGRQRPEELATRSPVFFLPRVLDLVGEPLSPYYALLREVEKHVGALQHGLMIDPLGVEISRSDLSAEAKRVLRDYRLVQYDLSVGQRYAEEMVYPGPAETVEASGTAE